MNDLIRFEIAAEYPDLKTARKVYRRVEAVAMSGPGQEISAYNVVIAPSMKPHIVVIGEAVRPSVVTMITRILEDATVTLDPGALAGLWDYRRKARIPGVAYSAHHPRGKVVPFKDEEPSDE